MPLPRDLSRRIHTAARGSRRPAGGARTSRDGPGGGPGIPSLARRRRRPREVPMAPPRDPGFMGIGGLVQRLQGGGPAQVGLGGMGRPGMGQQLQAPPMMPPGMPPPGGMGLQGMGQQQRQPMGGPQQQAMAGAQRQAMGLGGMGQQRQPMGGYGQPMGMGRPGMDQQRRDMGQQLSARSQLAGAQPGRAATRGIGPGMAYGGVPRLQGGQQVPPMPPGPGGPMPMGPPPGPALGGGGPNRLDALRGAPDIPLAGGPGIPGAGPGGDVIEEEGGTEGLPGAIVDTLMANTGGDPFQTLDILDQAVAMVEAELPEEDTGGVPDIEALLGGGGGGEPDIEALLGGGGGPDPMAMV